MGWWRSLDGEGRSVRNGDRVPSQQVQAGQLPDDRGPRQAGAGGGAPGSPGRVGPQGRPPDPGPGRSAPRLEGRAPGPVGPRLPAASPRHRGQDHSVTYHATPRTLVGRIFGHPLEGRDPDASRQKYRRPRFVQHEVADRAEDADLVAGPQACEGALVGGVRKADRVFEVRARGARRERHGRASMPSSVCSWRNVNWVGRNTKSFVFSSSIARVVGVSCREETTWALKPRGGPSNE